MPYNKTTQKDYGENPLQKKSSFTMKSGNSPLFKQMGSSPAKHTVAGPRAARHKDSFGKGHDNSAHPNYWKGTKENKHDNRKTKETIYGIMDKVMGEDPSNNPIKLKKINLGKGISNFFGALKGAGRKIEGLLGEDPLGHPQRLSSQAEKIKTDVSKLAKTDVPRKFVKDVKKTTKKIFGKKAREKREAWQIHKNVGTKYEGMNSFEKRMAKKAEAR